MGPLRNYFRGIAEGWRDLQSMEEPWYIRWPFSLFVMFVTSALFFGMVGVTVWLLVETFWPN